ncbi:hypothetical protein [Georgenia sunbinii]|uniref:hypothetical protein n=1 Tax=Georgenia sunbinii TaxID=3117728 RepID=UPI002F26269D
MTDLDTAFPPSPAPDRLTVDLGVAAATGALTLVDPARLGPLGRFAFRSSEAAVVGGMTWFGLKQSKDLEWQPELRVAVTSGVVAVTYAFAELSEVFDAAVVRQLRRRGVRRPRVAMAVAGVGLALTMSLLERRADARTAAADDDGDADEAIVRELPQQVRDIVAAILEQTEDHDSLRLRAQLAVAGEEVWGDDDGFGRMLELAVPDDVPLAVPHTFTFPVSGRFLSSRGVPCAVQLLVDGGRLSAVVIDVASDEWDAIADDWDDAGGDPDPLGDIDGWPAHQELRFVQETAGRP